MSIELLTEVPQAPPSGLGPYRREDYDRLPEQPRCELLFGRLYVNPAPSVGHQSVVPFLWQHLHRIARKAGGRALHAPLDVVLADHSVVQPDVIYISAGRQHIVQERILGAPDLVIEVLSPGTVRRDRGEKLSLYAQYGVREYWLVEHLTRRIDFLVNEADRFEPATPVAGVYRSPVLPEIHIHIAKFWHRVAVELPPRA
jgi:Uma2 family endonuclease